MPVLATGGAPIYNSLKAIRLMRHGCTNRPFHHIIIMGARRTNRGTYPVIEQLGTVERITNVHGEKLVSANLDRISYWLAQDKVIMSQDVKEILGLMGYLPIHPVTYRTAWRMRAIARNRAQAEKVEEEETSHG